MPTKSAALQEQINSLDLAIQQGAAEAQLNLWEMQRKELNDQLQVVLAEEASQQERVQTQEAEVQAVTLPYDFNELLSEEGHPVTNANEMIIEVVKDFKRQANIQKNQALDEQKSSFTDKENGLQSKIDAMQKIIENGTQANNELTREISDVRTYLQQVNLERDDAFNKRDAAFKQLQEAQDEISALKIKLENAPTSPQSFDISPSDKLAQMVKESLADKVNRGLARWPEIPTLAVPTLEPVSEVVAPATEVPFPIQATDSGTTTQAIGNENVEPLVGQPEIQVTRAEHEALKARVETIERHANIQAVA